MPKPTTTKPDTALVIAAAIIAAGTIALLAWILLSGRGGVELLGFPEGSTDVISYAGRFPAPDDAALGNPIGIDSDGEHIYVAESDAGRVAVFTLDGRRLDDIVVPVADGRTEVYPSEVALLGDNRLAVIDSASQTVLMLSTEGDGSLASVIGASGEHAPGPPTALTYGDGELFIADGDAHAVLVFSAESGAYLRTLGEGLTPPVMYIGGMFIGDDGLHIADSNAGRVLVIDTQSGELVRIFPERYSLPRGIVRGLDSEEFIVDTFNKTVVVVTDTGTSRAQTADLGEPLAALLSPRDACWIAEDQRLYVTDAESGEVVVYNVRLPVVP